MYFNVSVNFVYIGKYLPTTLSKHYEVPHLTDRGFQNDNFGTFKGDPTEVKNKSPKRKAGAKWAKGIR